MIYGIEVYDAFGRVIVEAGDVMALENPVTLNINQTVSANISKEAGQYIFRTFNTNRTYGLWEEDISVSGNRLTVKSLVDNGKFWRGRF